MVQKSCFCQLFNNLFVCSNVDIFFACFRNRFFNFIIYDVFTDNFRTGIGINMIFFFLLHLDNDSGVLSLLNALDVFFSWSGSCRNVLFWRYESRESVLFWFV